jgi:hypothetical protein
MTQHAMSHTNHLTFMTLLDWLEGRLTDVEAARVSEKLAASDADTQNELAWLRALLSVGGDVTLQAPPERIRQELLRRFRARDRIGAPTSMSHVASLSSDSQQRVGVRGASSGPRQLVYSSSVADVVINLQSDADGRVDLLGQIFPNDSASSAMHGFVVQLLKNGRDAGIVDANDLGEFSFSGLKKDRYDLVVSHADVEIQLGAIDIRAS